MKDLRIVIVSWNVEKLLGRCLRSLPDACRGLDWECVVVDNASKDDSVGMVRRIAQTEQRVSVVANAGNIGFAKACNQGAKSPDARYVLFLNPDTECPADSMARLVRVADDHPEAGIIGPKLLNEDGTVQPSIRRFPTVWDQLAIVLKLRRLFPGLTRRYLAKDVDPEKSQDVDQVMGACFLVRKALLDERLGFDERYFIWMEEVDFCMTAIQQGWKVLYAPDVSIVHHRGKSFEQAQHVQRQRMFTDSLRKYFRKWHPGWQSAIISAAAPVGVALVWLSGALKKPVVRWSIFVIALEIVSALTIFQPVTNSVATFILCIAVLLLAWKKPVLALGILLIELLIGSKGQLLQFGYWPVTTSVRILMTGAFIIGWGMSVIQTRRLKEVLRPIKERPQYAVLYLLIGYAVLRGIELGNGSDALKDANAWMDWLLLIPILDIVVRCRVALIKELVPAFFVCIFWLALKTLGLEYVFSHGFKSISPDAYLWVRRTGVGEVTLVVMNAFRIFMQSYVYATAAFLMAMSWLLVRPSPGEREGRVWADVVTWFILVFSTVILGISLSRSFWIGTVAGGTVLAVILTKEKIAWWKRLLAPISASIVGIMLITAVLAFPFPSVKIASLADLFGSRADTSEAAVVSRWNLMPVLWHKISQHAILGSGFGATVTYQTKDPRILVDHPDGMYTTYAFEWGWMEHWIKFGILGIPMMLWLLCSLGRRLWRIDEPLWFRAGAVSSLVALAALHFFTPYLNHPLGFVYFFVGEAICAKRPGRG